MKRELTSAQTRVLVALVLVYERDGRATVRTVAAEAGRGVMVVHAHLKVLRRLGFVCHEHPGSLRPCLVRVPFGVAA